MLRYAITVFVILLEEGFCQVPSDSQQDIVVRLLDGSDSEVCTDGWSYSGDSNYYSDFRDLDLTGIIRCTENGSCTEYYVFDSATIIPDAYSSSTVVDTTYDKSKCNFLQAIDNECGSGPVTLPPTQTSTGLDINVTDNDISSVTLAVELLSHNSDNPPVPSSSDPIIYSILVVPDAMSLGLSFLGNPECYAKNPNTGSWITATSPTSVFSNVRNTAMSCTWDKESRTLELKVNDVTTDRKDSVSIEQLTNRRLNHGRYNGEVQGMAMTLQTTITKTATFALMAPSETHTATTTKTLPTATMTGTMTNTLSIPLRTMTSTILVNQGTPIPTTAAVRKYVRIVVRDQQVCEYPWTDTNSPFISNDLSADDASRLTGVIRCTETVGCNEYYVFTSTTIPAGSIEYTPTTREFESKQCAWVPCLWDQRFTKCGDFSLSSGTTISQNKVPFTSGVQTDSIGIVFSIKGSEEFVPNIPLISERSLFLSISYPVLLLSNILVVGFTLGGLPACQFRDVLLIDDNPLNTTLLNSIYCLYTRTDVKLYVNSIMVKEQAVAVTLPVEVSSEMDLVRDGIIRTLGDVQLQGVRIVVNTAFRGSDLPLITPSPPTESPPDITLSFNTQGNGYSTAPSLSVVCPEGYSSITTIDVCTLAGIELGIPYRASNVPLNDSADVPPGCFYRDRTVTVSNTTVFLQGLWMNSNLNSNRTPSASELSICAIKQSDDEGGFRNSPIFGIIFACLAGICISVSYAYWAKIQTNRRKHAQGFYHDVDNDNGQTYFCPYPHCIDGPNGGKYESTTEIRLQEHISRRHIEERVLCIHRILAGHCEQCSPEPL